jgi:4-hydroxy-3-polyprenylbenzoate decarboxylase
MSFSTLRELIAAADEYGELIRISGADPDLEMSSITEIVYREGKVKPIFLFEDIPGYPKEYRTLFGQFGSPRRIAAILNLPLDKIDKISLISNWRNKCAKLEGIPPKYVKTSSVLRNSDTGKAINLLRFPAPRFHELDPANPYIGTACCVIQKDPATGYINVGTYRIMAVDQRRATLHVSGGQHGSMIMHEGYFSKNMAMPIAIAIGAPPILNLAAGLTIPWRLSEYDYAGGILGKPIEIIEGSVTGLPIPANAEIVIEGEAHPGEEAEEGPFGEWHGYYANLGLQTVPEPVIRVEAIHYRDDPILTCCQRTRPPQDDSLAMSLIHSAQLWTNLEKLGISGIKGVWCHEIGHAKLFNVISIKQRYSGHSKQVGIVASQYPVVGRYTITVDDDVDPTDLEDVIWAMITRCDVARSIQVLPFCRSNSQDPAIPVSEKMKYRLSPKPLYASRVIIDACQPYEYESEWYPVTRVSQELRKKILDKWGNIIKKLS